MRKLNLILMLFLFSFAFSMAQSNLKIDGNDPEDPLPMTDEVIKGKLNNGITYYVRENAKPENRSNIQLLIKAGSILETKEQEGLAHFIEHMCFNGTENFPKDSLVSFMENIGMRFGADVNANTGFDRTYYLLTIPMDDPNDLKNGFQVLEDWLHNVSFDPEEIEKERGVIMEEWRLYRGAQQRVQKKHLPNMLYKSRYAERLPIGDTTVIQNAPREEFVKFYTDWYRPDLSAVIAVGDFEASKMVDMIKDYFGDVKNPENPPERTEYDVPDHENTVVSIATDKELTYPSVGLFFKKDKPEKGTYGAYRNSIKNSLFSSMLSQRLQEKTREANPPYMMAQASIGSFVGPVDAFSLFGVPQNDMKYTLETILQEVFRVKQHGFTAQELERAKTRKMSQMEKTFKERNNIKHSNFARECYRDFMDGEGIPGIDYELKLHEAILPNISLSEINGMIDGLIRKKNSVITLSGPEDASFEMLSEDETLALFDEVRNSDLDPYMEEDLSKPLIEKEPEAGTIVEEEKMESIDAKKLVLSNGANVILKKTDFKEDEILMRAFSPGGHSLAEGDFYITASRADNIVDRMGLGDFSQTMLEKKLAGKMVSVSPYIGELTEGVRGNTSPEDIETFFKLVHLYFTQPRKDADAFASYKKSQIESIQNAKRSPQSAFRDTIQVTLGQKHRRSLPLTKEDIENIDLDKAIDFYKNRFADASDFTFIFVGNYDEEKMKGMLEKYVASLPSVKRDEKWKDVGMRYPSGNIEKEVFKGMEEKSQVRLAITGDFDYNRKNRFMLNAMNEVLRIRLREVIREDKGGVYGIGSYASMDQYPYENYLIQVVFGTAPKKVDGLIETVYDIMDEIKEGDFGKEYVSKVKEIMSRSYETNIKENRFWLSNIYYYTFNAEDPGWIKKYNALVKELDKDMIVDAANEYLDRDNLVEVVLYPEEHKNK